MKLLMSCMTCFQELGKPTDEFVTLEFSDNGRYEVSCSRGHTSVTALQQQKFEILFDIGANAIIDGYYREAISSFTSSLERFYEFCIKVFCENNSMSENTYLKAWKQVSNQSERQLGAFLFLWTNTFAEIPELLSNKDTKFRNEVIHKGKIPTKEEALSFGNNVLKIIRPKIKQLQSLFAKEISSIIFKHIRDCSKVETDQVSVGTMYINTIISLSSEEEGHHTKTLENALDSILKWRDLIESTESITNPRSEQSDTYDSSNVIINDR